MHMHVCVCVYMRIYICTCALGARPTYQCVRFLMPMYACMLCVCVCAAMYSLKISQPTEATVAAFWFVREKALKASAAAAAVDVCSV